MFTLTKIRKRQKLIATKCVKCLLHLSKSDGIEDECHHWGAGTSAAGSRQSAAENVPGLRVRHSGAFSIRPSIVCNLMAQFSPTISAMLRAFPKIALLCRPRAFAFPFFFNFVFGLFSFSFSGPLPCYGVCCCICIFVGFLRAFWPKDKFRVRQFWLKWQ